MSSPTNIHTFSLCFGSCLKFDYILCQIRRPPEILITLIPQKSITRSVRRLQVGGVLPKLHHHEQLQKLDLRFNFNIVLYMLLIVLNILERLLIIMIKSVYVM